MSTRMRPAAYSDWLSGASLWQLVAGEWVEVVKGSARHCPSDIAGESYLCTWGWSGRSTGGSQGHVPVQSYRDASHYRRERQSEPSLWVCVGT